MMVTSWPDDPPADLVRIQDLDRALAALEQVSPEHAEVVELRFMLGLTVEEASLASGVPERTIKRRWQAARAWLLDHLDGDGGRARLTKPSGARSSCSRRCSTVRTTHRTARACWRTRRRRCAGAWRRWRRASSARRARSPP